MIRWLIAAPALLFGLPTGMQGSANSQSSANHLKVTVGDRAHLKWENFSIGKGESVHFSQPGASSVVINHVVGGEMSQILGKLSAEGTLYLVNPSGIFIGKEALIDVGSFIASTMQGIGERVEERYHLQGSGGSITVDGKVIARSGDVILASHHVDCSGEMSADGSVAIAAGSEVIIQPGKGAKAFVKAIGGQRLTSDGNLYSLAINQKGVVDGRVVVSGSIEAKEVVISASQASMPGRVSGEKIDCRAITSLAASGEWSGRDIRLHSGGSLSLGRLQLEEGGSIALQMRHVNLGRLNPVLGDLLQRGDVTLVGESISAGDFNGYGRAFATDGAYRLRLEGGEVAIRESISLARDFEVKAKDLTIGVGDHRTCAPLVVESKEGNIELWTDSLHLFDGSEKTSLSAKEIAIHSKAIEIIAEGKGCDIHADEFLKIVGPGDLLIDARGAQSAITVRSEAIALKDIERGDFFARGAGASIQVRAETALGMSGGHLQSLASGASSGIEWSAPQMALHLEDFTMRADQAGAKTELISGALQLLTDKTITLAASGEQSLAQIALTTGGRNFIIAGEDLICTGDLGDVQIANQGGALDHLGLVVYAGRDVILDSRALIEIGEGDLALEAGRDLIFRGHPRMVMQKKSSPALQLIGLARGERREQAVTVGELFEAIAQRQQEGSHAFASFADTIKYAESPLMEPIELFNFGRAWREYIDFEAGLDQTFARAAKEHRCIEHILCQGMRELGLQGKFAATLRRGMLKGPVNRPASSRPWKVWAEAERASEPLAADID